MNGEAMVVWFLECFVSILGFYCWFFGRFRLFGLACLLVGGKESRGGGWAGVQIGLAAAAAAAACLPPPTHTVSEGSFDLAFGGVFSRCSCCSTLGSSD